MWRHHSLRVQHLLSHSQHRCIDHPLIGSILGPQSQPLLHHPPRHPVRPPQTPLPTLQRGLRTPLHPLRRRTSISPICRRCGLSRVNRTRCTNPCDLINPPGIHSPCPLYSVYRRRHSRRRPTCLRSLRRTHHCQNHRDWALRLRRGVRCC